MNRCVVTDAGISVQHYKENRPKYEDMLLTSRSTAWPFHSPLVLASQAEGNKFSCRTNIFRSGHSSPSLGRAPSPPPFFDTRVSSPCSLFPFALPSRPSPSHPILSVTHMLTYTRLEAGQAVAPFFLRVLRDASKNTAVVGQPRHGREYIKEVERGRGNYPISASAGEAPVHTHTLISVSL